MLPAGEGPFGSVELLDDPYVLMVPEGHKLALGSRPLALQELLLRQEPPHGKLQHVRVAACAVIGGHEVVADH